MRALPLPLLFTVFARHRSVPRCSSCAPVCSRYALNTAIACRTSSGSVVPHALEKPPAAPPKSLGLRGKSLLATLSGPNSTRQRGAACTNTGSMKAASIIASVHRPLAMSHAKTPSVSAASARSAHRPELMIARGSALRIQPPIFLSGHHASPSRPRFAPHRVDAHFFLKDASRTRLRLFLDRARHRRDVVLDEEGVEDHQRQRAD